MSKIAIVTGATSLIGVNLVPSLLEKGYQVYAVVRAGSVKKIPFPEQISRIECDLSQIGDLPEKVRTADVFFHLAWNGTRGAARNDKELQQANYRASLAACEAAKKIGCSCFVGAGSQAEYGVIDSEISEETLPRPQTEYGKAKLAFTQDGCKIAEKAHMRFIMPRFFSLFGKNDYENTIIQSLVTKLLRGEDCDLTACTQYWNFMYIIDAVQAMIHLVEGGFSGIYNFATQDTRPLRNFVESVKRMIGGKGNLLFGTIPYSETGAVSMRPRVDKLLATGFQPLYSFEKGVAEIIDYEKSKGGVE